MRHPGENDLEPQLSPTDIRRRCTDMLSSPVLDILQSSGKDTLEEASSRALCELVFVFPFLKRLIVAAATDSLTAI